MKPYEAEIPAKDDRLRHNMFHRQAPDSVCRVYILAKLIVVLPILLALKSILFFMCE